MSEPANSRLPTQVSLVLEIGEKKPVLKVITFEEQGKSPVSLKIERKG